VLIQAPIFLVLYAAFRDPHGPLATARVLGVPLSTHAFAAAGPAHLLVFGVLFAALGGLARVNSRRAAMLARVNEVAPEPGPGTVVARLARVLPYAVLISAAVLPLATGVYLVTTTAWSVGENALLRRGRP
jgi:YidC/Oxa1 family membrane protein insertase